MRRLVPITASLLVLAANFSSCGPKQADLAFPEDKPAINGNGNGSGSGGGGSAAPIPGGGIIGCRLSLDTQGQLEKGQQALINFIKKGDVTGVNVNTQTIDPSSAKIAVVVGEPKAYIVTVTGPAGRAQCGIVVGVGDASSIKPSCVVNAEPTKINVGQSVQLQFQSFGQVETATMNGENLALPTDQKNLTPKATTTYNVQIKGPNGENTCTSTVTVVGGDPNADDNQGGGGGGLGGGGGGGGGQPPPGEAPPCDLAANPAQINAGEQVVLTLTTDATAASGTINNQPVTVPGGQRSEAPTFSRDFVATVTGQNGKAASCTANVAVNAAPPPITCRLTANPTTVTRGASTTVTMHVTGQAATSSVEGKNIVPGGTVQIEPSGNSIRGHVTNQQGQNIQCEPANISLRNPRITTPYCYVRARGLQSGSCQNTCSGKVLSSRYVTYNTGTNCRVSIRGNTMTCSGFNSRSVGLGGGPSQICGCEMRCQTN